MIDGEAQVMYNSWVSQVTTNFTDCDFVIACGGNGGNQDVYSSTDTDKYMASFLFSSMHNMA